MNAAPCVSPRGLPRVTAQSGPVASKPAPTDEAIQRSPFFIASLRGVRCGMNGSWRDNYLLGTPSGQDMIGGNFHLVNADVFRDRKIWGQPVRNRAGIKNLMDLENNKVSKTGFTTMLNGANVYTHSHVMPPQYDLTVTAKF